MTRGAWASLLLERLGAPVSDRNLRALVSWVAAEGSPDTPPQAAWNPLNSTQKMPGSWDFNSVPVQNYPSLTVGLDATIKTLSFPDHGYERILRRLRKNRRAGSTMRAVEKSDWGTGGLASRVLRSMHRFNNYATYASKAIGQ